MLKVFLIYQLGYDAPILKGFVIGESRAKELVDEFNESSSYGDYYYEEVEEL